jgi:hypothetical protein
VLLKGQHFSIVLNEHFEEGAIVFREACKLGCEGIVSNRLGSPYRPGRSAYFQASHDDLGYVPPKWKATLLCAICHRVHEFNFAEARVCECPDDCCRQYGECQNCEFASRPAAA